MADIRKKEMGMGRSGLALIIGSMIVSMSGCVSSYGDGPDRAGYTQTGVVVRYDPAETSDEDVREEAQSLCDHYDLKAEARSAGTFLPEARYQGFDCVTASAAAKSGTLTEPAAAAVAGAIHVDVQNPPGLPDPPPMKEEPSGVALPTFDDEPADQSGGAGDISPGASSDGASEPDVTAGSASPATH